jgi:hypothetical protein
VNIVDDNRRTFELAKLLSRTTVCVRLGMAFSAVPLRNRFRALPAVCAVRTIAHFSERGGLSMDSDLRRLLVSGGRKRHAYRISGPTLCKEPGCVRPAGDPGSLPQP